MRKRGIGRRAFLTQAGAGLAAGVPALLAGRSSRAAANETLVLAMIGVRGRGRVLTQDFAARPDCQVAYIADVDRKVAEQQASKVASATGKSPQVVQDFRRLLDDKAVDAVVIATPDHWHALATIWACQAGKHVYVEKPASHNPWEGQKMVEAARKYNRVVQVGLQNRSAPYNQDARAYISSGRLGRVHLCRVFDQRLWRNIQAVPDQPVPEGLDWGMWTGPAPERPYNPNYHHSWNHFWTFSGGDIINDGVHQMDLARWLIGTDYPRSVYCTGGRFDEKGLFETPDTQVAVYEFDGLTMTFELTLSTPYMFKTDLDFRNSDRYPYWLQSGMRVEIYGSEGMMMAGRHGNGWQVLGAPDDQKPNVVAQGNGNFPDPEHKQDFVEAIFHQRRPSADIEEGQKSTLLCQLANISYRLGGVKLEIDARTGTIKNNPGARMLWKRSYRAPWVVPEQV